jgi:hypothetical protein
MGIFAVLALPMTESRKYPSGNQSASQEPDAAPGSRCGTTALFDAQRQSPVFILVGVDVVLGPAITLFIFDQEKIAQGV